MKACLLEIREKLNAKGLNQLDEREVLDTMMNSTLDFSECTQGQFDAEFKAAVIKVLYY